MQAKVHSPEYGRGVVTIDGDEKTDDLLESLRNTFSSPAYQPPLLPAAAIELIELSRKPDVTIAEVVRLVEHDPFIAARVLQVAQSARYCASGGVPSLQHAAVRLGLDTMTNIFLEVATHMRVFRAAGYEEPMGRLRRHSVATANVARIVCRHTAIYDDYAFLCGLLHDVGIAASMILLAEKRSSVRGAFGVEWPSIREVHEEASRVLCEAWRLPADVAFAVSHHHDDTAGKYRHPVASAIAVAEHIAEKLGFAFENEVPSALPTNAIRSLALSEASLDSITLEAKGKLATAF